MLVCLELKRIREINHYTQFAVTVDRNTRWQESPQILILISHARQVVFLDKPIYCF